jgi:hypothetical protein
LAKNRTTQIVVCSRNNPLEEEKGRVWFPLFSTATATALPTLFFRNTITATPSKQQNSHFLQSLFVDKPKDIPQQVASIMVEQLRHLFTTND